MRILVPLFTLIIIWGFKQNSFYDKLSDAAVSLENKDVVYDSKYRTIPYPNGDVADSLGVCTDVVIRAYRKLGIDLQQLVHEDMLNRFSEYPKIWGMKKPDSNIDHRRVPNLVTFFKKYGTTLTVTANGTDYLPGDIVTWDLGNGITHIGIVVNKKSDDGKRNKIMHNIGLGQVLEDCLFCYKITGHYRYKG